MLVKGRLSHKSLLWSESGPSSFCHHGLGAAGSRGPDAFVGGGEPWREGHWGKDQTIFHPLQEPEDPTLGPFPICTGKFVLPCSHLHSECNW